MTPSLGRTVHYCLTKADAEAIREKRRLLSGSFRGNSATEGDVFAAVIVRTLEGSGPLSASTLVNLKVQLDGDDTLWVTDCKQSVLKISPVLVSTIQEVVAAGVQPGEWFEPPRVPSS